MENDPIPHLRFPSCADCVAMGAYVPGMLMMMEDALGADALRHFLLRYGGREINVRVRFGDDPVHGWLHENVGYGRIVIPRGPSRTATRARFSALMMMREALSTRHIANALNVHIRTVSIWKTNFTERGLLAAAA